MSFEDEFIWRLTSIGSYVIPSPNGVLKTKYYSESCIREALNYLCLEKQKVEEDIKNTVMLEEELYDVPNFRSRRKDMNYAIGEFKKKLLWVLKLDEARK